MVKTKRWGIAYIYDVLSNLSDLYKLFDIGLNSYIFDCYLSVSNDHTVLRMLISLSSCIATMRMV